jgi:hypothetical protein
MELSACQLVTHQDQDSVLATAAARQDSNSESVELCAPRRSALQAFQAAGSCDRNETLLRSKGLAPQATNGTRVAALRKDDRARFRVADAADRFCG